MRNYSVLFLLGITTLCFSCGLLLPGLSDDSFAAGARDEYHKVQKDLRKQKKKLVEATRTERLVTSDIKRVESQIADIEEQVSATKKQMHVIKGNMTALEGQIEAGSQKLEAQRLRLRKRLRTLQKINDSKEIMLMLLSNEDPSTVLRVSRSLTEISKRYTESIKGYHAELVRLGGQKRKLGGLVGNLRAEEQSLSRLEQSVKAKKQEKELLLVNVRKEKDKYQRMIRQLKGDSDRLQNIIRESERRDKSYKGKAGKGRRGAHDSLPADSEFTRMKGQLSWPVQGKVVIKYGSQIDPIFNLPVFRSGIHIRAKAGSYARAVWQGKVVYAAEFKGYGRMVVISHGSGYHSLYGNLSGIFLKNDDIIKANTPVGTVGESDAIGGSGLYFEIRYKGKPLDPRQWLGRSGG
jgi:murein hydrolase activator